MKPDLEPRAAYPRFVQVCAVGAGSIGLLALASWTLDMGRIFAPGDDYRPMAPSTACLIVLLAAALFLRGRRPARPATLWVALVAALVAAAMGLLVLAGVFFGFEPAVERWLAPASESVGGFPVGRMTPMTASAFLFVAVSLMLDLPPLHRRGSSRQTASLLALVPLLMGSVVLLSYAVDEPLLSIIKIHPMALLTAVSFVLLSLALLVSAGPDTWLFGLLATRTPGRSPRPSGGLSRSLWAVLLMTCVAIITAMHLYAKQQMAESRRKIQDDLHAIADFKSRQIACWYEESLTGAQLLLTTPMVRSRALEFLSGPSQTGLTRDLLNWTKTVNRVCRYRMVVLYDSQGSPRLAMPQNANLPDARNDAVFRAAMETKGLVTMDLDRDQGAGSEAHRNIHIDFWIPVRLDDGTAAGAWLVRIDPHVFLYPLIQSWPTASGTAETLLVRREGDDILFINELRHREDTALSLRLPISTAFLPAAAAVLGHEGVMEGIDYRGVPVLAAMRRVPGTPWFMVAKVDQEEIYAPLRERALTMAVMVVAMVLMAGLAVSLVQRRRDEQWLERHLAGERFREFATRLLEGINRQTVGQELLREIMRMVKGFTGVEAVGIRLREGDDFPYFVAEGFPERFVEAERHLCTRDPAGELVRDPEGNPYLECMCGNVILGRTDPKFPFFTENGSFWTNSTTELLADTTEKDRRARTRNRCNGEGYESVALIPLRVGNETIGLLQLNDKRPGCHSPEMVRFLEEMGASIGIAVERARLEAELKDSERRYRAVVEDQVDLICRFDRENRYVFVNDAFCRFFGKPKEALIGREWFPDVHPEDLGMVREKLATLKPSNPVVKIENRVFSGKGDMRWMQFVNRGLYDPAGRLFEVQVVARDITESKDAEARIETASWEKETLLREIQHRVKNNLQSVIALLQMRSPKVEDQGARRILDEVQAQVRAMALVYEQLFEAKDLSRVAMQPYLKKLAMNVMESLGRGRSIGFAVDVSDDHMNLATAMPCGLIVNELLSNTFKHAWPEGFEGRRRFEVGLRRLGERAFELRVADNGVGIPAEVCGGQAGSMGMKLVHLWATHQLGGTIDFESGQGTVIRVVFEPPRLEEGIRHGQD